MGQRLVLQIAKNVTDKKGNVNEKILANAYYHWGAYTSVAASYTADAINFLEFHNEEDYADDVLYAIRALEDAEGGFEIYEGENDSPYDNAKATYPGEDFNSFPEEEEREWGIIGFTENEKKWHKTEAEHTVTINLTDRTVDFGVFSSMSYKECIEDGILDGEDLDNLDEYLYNPHCLDWDEVEGFTGVLADNSGILLSSNSGVVYFEIS